MEQILLKAFAFVFVIAFGYTLKKIKFFKEEDYKVISKVVINITLPAAIISSFKNFEKDTSLFYLVLLGLICNAVMVGLGYLLSKTKGDKVRALYMLNMAGYNIGAFSLPFVQSFLGPFGVIAICMFDMGNAVSCTGGSYAVTSAVLNRDGNGFSVKSTFGKLFSSVPFLVYMVMLLVVTFNIHIPKIIISVTSLAGAANGFASMFMIGLMFNIKFKLDYLSKAGFILLVRYAASGIMAFIFYNFLPFPLEIRQVMAIAVLAPGATLSPIFTDKCGGDMGVASFVSSTSILISTVLITTMLIILNITG